MPDPFVKCEIHEKKVMLSVWSTTLKCKDWPTRFAIRKEHPKLDNPSYREEDFPENSGARTGSSTASTVQPGPGFERPPPLLIASASPKEKRYDDRDHLENDLRAFFTSMSTEFYAKGIRDLMRRWQKVADVDGDYFVVVVKL
ncbi:hypothetical protein RB195_024747 [Necator americanus]|uniref:Uncharacterized protein n=1 Tax=Necator americanus TaxID=51031 RepID=A0ABR1EPQ5_NECAM